MSPRKVNVLALDGGGIRGIIPAMILAELERRAQQPVCQLFDLVAGTSTGGLLALALTVPGEAGQPKYRAAEVAALFERAGRLIFAKRVPNAGVYKTLRHYVGVVLAGTLVGKRYLSAGLDTALQQHFGEATLAEALTEVLITSYDIERRQPHVFTRCLARATPAQNFPLWQVGRATSALPTYFDPCLIQRSDTERLVLVDGGLYAYNPALCALAEVHRWQQGACSAAPPDAPDRSLSRRSSTLHAHPDTGIRVLSLGTGALARPYAYEKAVQWGLSDWARPLLDMVCGGSAVTTDDALQQLVPGRYYRLQPSLEVGMDTTDNAENLDALTALAAHFIQDNTQLLDQIVEELSVGRCV